MAADQRCILPDAGLCPRRLLGASYRDVTHPDDVDADREFVADALAGRRDSMQREKRYVRKDGSIVWARTRVEVIRDRPGSPLYFVSHVQDLSGQRATLGLLHGSERTLRSVIDQHAGDDLRDGSRSSLPARQPRVRGGRSGSRSDWIVGRSDTEVLPPSMRSPRSRAQNLLVLDGGVAGRRSRRSRRMVRSACCWSRGSRLRDEDGAIDAVCVVSTDVTERRVRGARQARAVAVLGVDLLGAGPAQAGAARPADRQSDVGAAGRDRAADPDAQDPGAQELIAPGSVSPGRRAL